MQPLQPPCGCKHKCIDKVSHERKEIIYKQYCAINKKLQKEFLFQRIQSFPKKRSRIRVSPKKKRNDSRIYSLNVNGKDIAVCSKSFLGTLGYKKDNVISALFNKQTPTKSRPSASDFPDMRGRHAPIHKMSESKIQRNHRPYGSYHPSVSHYRRKHAPLRRYLPSGMTVAEMHSNYKEKHPDEKVCYESYRKNFCINENKFH